MKKQILAMGGGGFLMEPDNCLLDKYVLSLAHKPKPKICFLATACGDAQTAIAKFYNAFSNYDCEPSHLSLFNAHTVDFQGFLLSQDIIYVGGGNTRNMLVLWKEWGIDKILNLAYEKGIVLSGISAGAICWFEQGLTDSVPGTLSKLNCLGFLKGSNCPHYDSEISRRPAFMKLLGEMKILPGLACDDGVGLHYVDGHLEKVVSSHPDAKAYKLVKDAQGVSEKQIIPTYLGGEDTLIRRASLSDAYSIHEAHMKSIREVCSKDYPEESIQAWGHRQFNGEQRHKAILNDYVWILESKGVIEGYGHLTDKGRGLFELTALYITSDFIGKGHGRRIFDLMVAKIKELGGQKLNFCSTITARDFYEKQGAHCVGELKEMNMNGTGIKCYSMEYNIS